VNRIFINRNIAGGTESTGRAHNRRDGPERRAGGRHASNVDHVARARRVGEQRRVRQVKELPRRL
jgi:hypothetical protein